MAPQASRRFHEAGVGSRTGLRLSAVARDQDGFEDLEAFYKASEAALDHQQQAVPEEEDEEDYDSFDEAPFSHRSGVNGRAPAAASSSMTMDIQDSSAPSPRSMLRSARQSAANKGKTSASNVTLRDDDDNGIYDLDLPNLSTGSRSFDLGEMRLRSSSSPCSITEDATAEAKVTSKASNQEAGSSTNNAAVQPCQDSNNLKVTASSVHVVRNAITKTESSETVAKSRQPEPEPEPTMYGEEDYDDDYDEPAPLTLPRSPEQPPKKKRGRPPKSATTNGTSTQSKTKASTTSKSSASSKTKRNPGEVVQKVRSQPTVTATVFDENGVRRSTRQRFAPLEYWRGERIRYGRPSLPSGTTIDDFRRRPGEDEFEDDPSLMIPRRRVPVLDIKEVIRVPRAPGEGTFSGTTTRPRNTTSHSKMDRKSETPRPPSRTPDLDGLDFIQLDPTANTVHVEDGWDANTLESGLVIDDSDGHETTTSIVRTKASLRPMAAAGQEFKFEKLFNCAGLMATGVLHLPPGTRKPTKPSKDNSFVFCVLQGALRATVHRKSFIVGPEGVFQVPAGNNYSLENVCERDLKLFFAQCRKTTKVGEGMGDLTTFTQYSDTSYGTPKAAAAGVGVRQVLGNVGGRGERGRRRKVRREVRRAR
ncbi:hypothetical protein NDA10_003985 [Ustilago hordei]|nr:hypothetical protein NDA10_003985 [Ustilago hordei]